MLNAGGPRVHRTGLQQLLALWGALPRTIRRFVGDFAAVAAEEGRELPARLAWAAGAAVIAGILVVAGWLLLCAATASWLTSAHGWRWEMSLYAVAAANLLLAVIATLAAYRSLKSPLFPFTSYELNRLRSSETRVSRQGVSPAAEMPLPHPKPGSREQALIQSEAELEARLTEVRHATRRLIATPSVIAATAGVGFVAGYITSKRKARTTVVSTHAAQVPLTRQLMNIAFGQLSSLAVAAAMRELQRRTGHDGRMF